MAYRIKKITGAETPRANVTIEEVDAQEKPTGREWTEPFDTEKNDWLELKQRFKKRIKDADVSKTFNDNLVVEANNANIADISLTS